MKKIILLIAALALLAAACKSDTTIETGSTVDDNATASAQDSSDPDTTDQDADDSDASDVTADADTAEGDTDDESGVQAVDPTPAPAPTEAATAAPAPTTAPADASPAASSPEIEAAVQAVVDADDWCEAANAVENGMADLELLNFTDPAAVQAGITQSLAVVSAAQRLAPPEIAAEVETTVEGFTVLVNALEAVNWNFLDLDLSIIESLDGDMELATYNIELYNFNECGIGTDPGEPPVILDDGSVEGSDDLPEFEGTIREQAVQSLVEAGFTVEEADCIFAKLDLSDPEAFTDTTAVLAVFTECGISLDRLAQLGG